MYGTSWKFRTDCQFKPINHLFHLQSGIHLQKFVGRRKRLFPSYRYRTSHDIMSPKLSPNENMPNKIYQKTITKTKLTESFRDTKPSKLSQWTFSVYISLFSKVSAVDRHFYNFINTETITRKQIRGLWDVFAWFIGNGKFFGSPRFENNTSRCVVEDLETLLCRRTKEGITVY